MDTEGKKIHFIGAGGIGVSALARLMRLSGAEVSGSDMRQSAVTDGLRDLGCRIFIGHSADNLEQGTDLVIHTEDVNETSAGFVELEKARSLGIRTLKYSQALGEFMSGFRAVGVSGTNGKSTTTAILGLIMQEASSDPMVVLGSKLAPTNETESFRGNARFGRGEWFVYEADEYHRHMLDSHPFAAVLTNIEADHLDYYRDLDDIMSAFRDYVSSIPADGVLVYNIDDANAAAAAESAKCRTVSFSMDNPAADYYAYAPTVRDRSQSFEVSRSGESLGEFILRIPGAFNVMNALGAIALAVELGVDAAAARRALASFQGIWRRFELAGRFGSADVVSDYAHHPTAVTGLIEAAKQFYPDQRILLVFQPHQKNRTRTLFDEFVRALRGVDRIILPEIYFVPGREPDGGPDVSSRELCQAVSSAGQPCDYAPDLNQAESMVRSLNGQFDLIVCAGAGTIDILARRLVSTSPENNRPDAK